MIRCTYPNCRLAAVLKPVVALPTVRTKALVKPEPLKLPDPQTLAKMGLDAELMIRQHEEAVREFKEHERDVVLTDKPTWMIFNPLCKMHADKFKLTDQVSVEDWGHVQEAARAHGLRIQSIDIIAIQFRPINWEPNNEFMELERD